VANPVHAAVHTKERTGTYTAGDRLLGKTGIEELPPRDYSVMRERNSRDLPCRCPDFHAHMAYKSGQRPNSPPYVMGAAPVAKVRAASANSATPAIGTARRPSGAVFS
jgi:hypothetical protein